MSLLNRILVVVVVIICFHRADRDNCELTSILFDSYLYLVPTFLKRMLWLCVNITFNMWACVQPVPWMWSKEQCCTSFSVSLIFILIILYNQSRGKANVKYYSHFIIIYSHFKNKEHKYMGWWVFVTDKLQILKCLHFFFTSLKCGLNLHGNLSFFNLIISPMTKW